MNIYEFTTSLTVTGGSANAASLRIIGGLLNQFLVRANTLTTVFQASLVDEDSITRLNYDFHAGELNDLNCNLPMKGTYTVNITNASAADTFRVILAVRE